MREGANLLRASISSIRDPPNPKEKSARAFKKECILHQEPLWAPVYTDFHINDHFAVFSQPVGKVASDVVTVVKRNKILVGISRVNNVIILIP